MILHHNREKEKPFSSI